MGADVFRIEGGDIPFLVIAEEHVAVHVLDLEHVALHVAGVGFQTALGQDLVIVHVHDVDRQAGEGFLEGLLDLLHLGGGGVDVDGAAVLDFLESQLIELFVAHFAPVVKDGAVEGAVLNGGGGLLGGGGFGRGSGGGFVLRCGRGGGGALAAAGGQRENHYQRHKQCGDLAQIHVPFSFQIMDVIYSRGRMPRRILSGRA